jgi:EAL domain-containing protein (putative c-di-GMP-specific phosphodiesterase class I)
MSQAQTAPDASTSGSHRGAPAPGLDASAPSRPYGATTPAPDPSTSRPYGAGVPGADAPPAGRPSGAVTPGFEMPGFDIPGTPGRPHFIPIIDLDTGGVIAVEVIAATIGGPVAGVAGTVNGVLAAAQEEALLPLLLPIPVSAVLGGSAGLASLHEALRATNRRPREVILVIEGDVSAGDRRYLLSGIEGLRAVGYLIAFGNLGSSYVPLELVADASPYVILISPDVVERGPRDPRRSGLAESLVTFAKGIGAHVLAPGVRDETQLGAVRGWGIRLAQGPLLAAADWRPSLGHSRVHVPLPLPETTPVNAMLGPRVQEFLLPAVTLPMESSAEDVMSALSSEPSITSIILVDEYQRPQGSIDRSRFLLFMAGAYGHALHARKPAHRLSDTAKVVPKTTPAIAAMQVAGRDNARVYDDLVVVDEVGRCMGIVRVGDLIRHVADMQPGH